MADIKMRQNLHTHCVFCDGKDTPRDMVERALELGFSSLGFSSHANTVINDTCELGDDRDKYIKEITRLKKEYEGRIEILLGTELDYFSAGVKDGTVYDYKIASVHYGKVGDEYVSYDLGIKHSEDAIRRHFDGDVLAYARLYYETMADMPNKISGDFVGHFDLLTKYEEKAPHLYKLDSEEYKKMALDALLTVRERFDFFEVNTGTIGRGYKSTPYPAPFILDAMRDTKCKLIITTDCHNKQYLDCGFDTSVELIKAHGFTEIYELCGGEFIGRKI